MKRPLLILPAIIMFAHAAQAQQLFNAPQLLNPAMTGFTPADVRASFNYSTSRPYRFSPTFSSATFAADAPVLQGKLPMGDAVGIGISSTYSAFNDDVRAKNIGLSAAYHKALGKKRDQYLSLGVQGLVNTWPPRDSMAGISYPIYRAGLMYTRPLAKNAIIYGGYTFSYLGEPFNDTWESATTRTGHRLLAGVVWNANERLTLNASILAEALKPSIYYYFTAMGGYTLKPGSKNPTTIYLGGMLNYRERLSPYVGIEKHGFRLALSPHMNTGSYSRPLRVNSYEISLLWHGHFKKHSDKHKGVKPFPRIY
jgi:hypothetical protein